MFKSTFFRFSVLVLSTLFLNACFVKMDPRWKSVEQMALVKEDLKAKTCERMKSRSAQLTSLKALYSLDFNLQGTNSLRASLAFKAPDNVRVEVLPPNLAVAIYLAVINGKQGLILDVPSKKAFSFEDSTKILPKLLDLNLSIEDLVYILSARVPLRLVDDLCKGTNKENDIFFKYAPDGAGVSIIDLKKGSYWTVNLHSGLLRTVLLREGMNGGPILSGDFTEEDFLEPGNEFPRDFSAVLGNNLVTINTRTSISKINSTVNPQVFKILSVPANFKEKKY